MPGFSGWYWVRQVGRRWQSLVKEHSSVCGAAVGNVIGSHAVSNCGIHTYTGGGNLGRWDVVLGDGAGSFVPKGEEGRWSDGRVASRQRLEVPSGCLGGHGFFSGYGNLHRMGSMGRSARKLFSHGWPLLPKYCRSRQGCLSWSSR